MIGVYNYTVVLTYLGMLVGFCGISFAMHSNIRSALICLIISGLCDMFDGKIASTMDRTKQAKRFGVQIDSLSDLICFGVLPALIVYRNSNSSRISFCVAALYVLCALIRLAWFNVDEETRQDIEQGEREVYYGLPVTTSALIFPILLGICKIKNLPENTIAPVIMIITAVCFLMPFQLKKPTIIGKVGVLFFGAVGLTVVLAGIAV